MAQFLGPDGMRVAGKVHNVSSYNDRFPFLKLPMLVTNY